MRLTLSLRITFAAAYSAALACTASGAAAAGPWDGAPPESATLVGLGTISTAAPELGLTLSPDGATAYVTRLASDRAQPGIYEIQWKDGAWSAPRQLFPGDAMQVHPSLSADGARMVFLHSPAHSYRFEISEAIREGDRWSAPHPLAGLKLTGNAFDPTWGPDGSLYFAVARPELWDLELQRAAREGAGFAVAAPPGARLNSRYDDSAPCLSPDGKLLVFASSARPEGSGAGDLYISEQRDGRWLPARNLGPRVNTAGDEGHPRFSPDGRRLFFCRDGDIYQIATTTLLQPLPESVRAWQPRASLPQGRVWPRCVALNDRIYLIGGNSGWGQGMGPLQSMLEYDPATDVWRERAAPPQGDVLAPAVALEGRIVLLQHAPGALGFEYDPAADRWTARAGATPISDPTPHNSAAAMGGRLFATRSMWAASQPVGDLLEYDTTTTRWHSHGATPLAPPGELLAHEGRLYLVGGGGELKGAAVFDPVKGVWAALPHLSVGHVEVRCAWWRNQLVAIGGHTNRDGVTLDLVEYFDPVRNAWQQLPRLPQPRWGAGVVVCSGRLFVIGGSADSIDGGPAAATVWEYTPETM